ncbi:MAG TPA: hypothetical protein VMU50_00765, partial [Polyangia bacterium]|nr:hypothetical protein [Polyangia bacterium]
MKRLVAVIVAAAALGAAAAGARAIDANRVRAIKRENAQDAETAGLRANEALANHVGLLKLKAQSVASNPRLEAALRGNVDAATLSDLFRTEEWWAPYRSEFKVYAVSFRGEHLDVVEGMAGSAFAADALVRAARQRNEAAAEIVLGKGWPYAAAAVAVSNPERREPAVLVLAKPIDQAALATLAERTRGAVLLSDGASPLLEAGDESERARLRQAVGHERPGPLYEPAEGDAGWAAAISQLAPSLWLFSYASAGAAAAEVASSAMKTKDFVWGIAALASLAALFFGFRRGDVAPPPFTAASVAPGLAAPPVTPVMPPAAPAGGTVLASLASAATQIQNATPGPQIPPPANAVMFGRYRLLDRLGEGGMAEVYTAVTFGAEGFRRTFVVKRLRAELARDPAVVAQFIDEANMGSTLVHSNIVPVFD